MLKSNLLFKPLTALSLLILSTSFINDISTYLVEGVLTGDEQYGEFEGGKFWVFHTAGISIINPTDCKIEKTITHDTNTNERFPDAWYDGVYMERTQNVVDNVTGKVTYAAEYDDQGYIFINSGVTKFTPQGSVGEVFVFSTHPKDIEQPLLGRIEVGGKPSHSYAVWKRDQFWTHSDETGEFFIVDLKKDLTDHVGKTVDVKKYIAFNGKLLWDETDDLHNIGYATSVGEKHLFVIDMINQETIGTFSLVNHVKHRTCSGTNSIAYSKKNKHLYIQCTYNNNHPGMANEEKMREEQDQAKRHIHNPNITKETFVYIHGAGIHHDSYVGAGGIIELDVSNPTNPKFVAQHLDVTGSLYETPDESYVVAANKEKSILHVFRPEDNGEISTLEFNIDVPGHPENPTFYKKHNNGIANYVLCMPLTENTNRNNMDEHGELVCDKAKCSQARTARDARNGVCLYDESMMKLQTITVDEIQDVVHKKLPYADICYDNCHTAKNFHNGECVCTPHCGSCADDDYDPRFSGVRCVDMKRIFMEQTNRANIIRGAGSVLQAKPSLHSKQCGFSTTMRPHRRGARYYDASIANFPSNSLQIINMDQQKFHCSADLIGLPKQVIYAPPPRSKRLPPNYDDDNIPEEEDVTVATPTTSKRIGGIGGGDEDEEVSGSILTTNLDSSSGTGAGGLGLDIPPIAKHSTEEKVESDIAGMFVVAGVIVMFVLAGIMIRKKVMEKKEADNVIEFVGTELSGRSWRDDGFFDY